MYNLRLPSSQVLKKFKIGATLQMCIFFIDGLRSIKVSLISNLRLLSHLLKKLKIRDSEFSNLCFYFSLMK